MPKTKTHSGAKKRFKVTGTGKIKHDQPGHSHILTKKSQKRKRLMRQESILEGRSVKAIKIMLGQ
jgi:large subunit ribosomal protein L35